MRADHQTVAVAVEQIVLHPRTLDQHLAAAYIGGHRCRSNRPGEVGWRGVDVAFVIACAHGKAVRADCQTAVRLW